MRERTKIAQIQQDIPARAPGQFDLFPPDPGQLARRGGFKVLEARDTRGVCGQHDFRRTRQRNLSSRRQFIQGTQ